MSYKKSIMLLAQLNITKIKNLTKYMDIADIKLKVFSQWNEEEITQYLNNKCIEIVLYLQENYIDFKLTSLNYVYYVKIVGTHFFNQKNFCKFRFKS